MAAARKKPRAKTAKARSSSRSAAKKTGRKRAAPARKAAARPKARPRAAAKATAKPKAAARPAARISPTELLARKLIKQMQTRPDTFNAAEIYAPDCSSVEPGAQPVVGVEALSEKGAWWQSMVKLQRWQAKSHFVKGTTICIEWEAEIEFEDGRKVTLNEIAIHETKAGKITAERYYYDPALLAPPEPEATVPEPEPQPTAPPRARSSSPPLDPLDL